jgi:hypothetical protein
MSFALKRIEATEGVAMAQEVMSWEAAHHKTFWSDGVWPGLIAGVVFMSRCGLHDDGDAAHVARQGRKPMGAAAHDGGHGDGEEVLPPPASFEFASMMAAMMVHFVLSIIYGLIGAWIVHRLDFWAALLIGAVYGFAIYVVNFHVIVPTLFSWFVAARGHYQHHQPRRLRHGAHGLLHRIASPACRSLSGKHL